MQGILLNLDGSRFVKDQMEYADLSIPMTTPQPSFLVSSNDDDVLSTDDDTSSPQKNPKRRRLDSNTEVTPPVTTEHSPLYRHYAYVCAVDVDSTILENAEICGTNLAVKLMQMGAASILEEIREKVPIIPTQS